MVNHKIQSSSSSGLQLYLSQVPKMLRMLTLKWATKSYIISFKLETDENILYEKAWKAICNYRVNLVVANLLHTRTNVCYLIYDNNLVVSNVENYNNNNNNNNNNNHEDKVIKESQYEYQMITNNLSVDNRSVEIINKEHGIIESILVSKIIEKHINFYNQSNKNDDMMNTNYSNCHTDDVVNNMLSFFQQYIDIINTGGK
jgi:hypothetical protein